MASLTPNSVTEVVPGAWTAAGIVSALTSFFASGGGASTFTNQFTGVDSLVIRSTIDTVPQYSIRATGESQIDFEIEPSGSLTDAGNASTRPAGASADNSGAGRFLTLGTMGDGSKMWVIEHDDCVTVLIKSTAGTSWQPSFQIGRVYQPDFPDVDEPLGRDGLGCLIGAPHIYPNAAATPDAWVESTVPTSGSFVHVATNIWDEPNTEVNCISTNAAMDSAASYGYVRPYNISMRVQAAPYGGIGVFKYVKRVGETRAPLTRIDVNNLSNLCWIVGGQGGSTAATPVVIPWLRGVVP